MAELMVEVHQQLTSLLTEEPIRDWHETPFPGSRIIRGGQLVIVSGSQGREIILYEVPW